MRRLHPELQSQGCLWFVIAELFSYRKAIRVREDNAILKANSVRKLFGRRELTWPVHSSSILEPK